MAATQTVPADLVVAGRSVYQGSIQALRGEVAIAVTWCSCGECGPKWFTPAAVEVRVAVRLQGGKVLTHVRPASFADRTDLG